MDITVIICTYNRAHNLSACLGRLAGQRGVDDLQWEVLVVDNNSTDATRATVAELARTLPVRIRYAFEAQQGLNYARNRGAQESLGRYFGYIDDDIQTSPNWLAALHDALVTNDADAVGGRIHLDPGLELPAWIQPEMLGFLGYQDFGEAPFEMDGVSRYPFGGNMFFHRRVVDRIGLFDPKLGRRGSGQRRGELFKGAETDYFHRLAAYGGARIYYEPRAIVYHQVQPFQLTKKYFRTIHYNAGFQKALHDERRFDRTLMGVPLFLFPQLARNVGAYLRKSLTEGPDAAFRQQMTVGNFVGTMLGYARRSRLQEPAAGREATR
jgi:glycosyltransferase involved in cell wall biosynthesis